MKGYSLALRTRTGRYPSYRVDIQDDIPDGGAR
jgi:hypothetical protein